LETKRKVIKSCILSIALYGSETWTLGINKERVVNTFDVRSWKEMLKVK
jgi:hypothetical protein